MYKNTIFLCLFLISCASTPSFEIVNKDLKAEILKYVNADKVPYGRPCNTESILLGISESKRYKNRLNISLDCNGADVCRDYIGSIKFGKQKISLCIYPNNESMKDKISELVKINYQMSLPTTHSTFKEFGDIDYIYENGILRLDTFSYKKKSLL